MFKLYLEPKGKRIRQFRVYTMDDRMICASNQRSFNAMWLDKYEAFLAGKESKHTFDVLRYSTDSEFLGEYSSRGELVNAIEMYSLLEDATLRD